jgi:peptidoglycan/xylan/chitin deacetylase (PgdA/CDA1 family)
MIDLIIDKSLILYRKLYEVVCKVRIFAKNPKPVNGKIFMYHGLTDKQDYFKHINVKKFERHIKFLVTHYRPVHLEELLEMSEEEKKDTFALTFDDGYRSVFFLAYPILKKYNVPFTMFVVTGALEKGEYIWNDRLDNTIKGIKNKVLKTQLNGEDIDLKISGKYRLGLKLADLRNKLKKLNISQINDFIISIEEEYSPSVHYGTINKLITIEQIKEMIGSKLCRIGSHTCNHLSLINISSDEIRYEVSESLNWLKKELGEDNYFFCYPHGHFNSEVIKILEQYNYTGAVTTVKGTNSHINNVYLLNRNPVNMEDLSKFRILHDL